MDNKLVLGYWPIRGLAQPIRAMLHYLELPFEDKLYNDYKLWFETDRPSFKNPLANLPYLKVGEKVLDYCILRLSLNLMPFITKLHTLQKEVIF